MLNDQEYEEAMDAVAQARKERDEVVDAALERFTDALVEAYETGLTIADIGHATGVSVTTIRSKFKQRGVIIRGGGR